MIITATKNAALSSSQMHSEGVYDLVIDVSDEASGADRYNKVFIRQNDPAGAGIGTWTSAADSSIGFPAVQAGVGVDAATAAEDKHFKFSAFMTDLLRRNDSLDIQRVELIDILGHDVDSTADGASDETRLQAEYDPVNDKVRLYHMNSGLSVKEFAASEKIGDFSARMREGTDPAGNDPFADPLEVEQYRLRVWFQ